MGIFGKKDDAGNTDGEQPLETYKVVYKGGLADLPKAKSGEIRMQLMPTAFELHPTIGSKSYWNQLTIPYHDVKSLQIVARQQSTFESVLGGPNAKPLNDENNIHIEYASGDRLVLLRLEMLSGVTVSGQAKKCRELMDRLRTLGILDRFQPAPAVGSPNSGADVPAQIARLAELRDQGILTEAEFDAKKADLLGRM